MPLPPWLGSGAAQPDAGAAGYRVAPSLRSLLAGLVAIVLLPSALLIGCLLAYGYGRARTYTEAAALDNARLLAGRVDRRISEAQQALNVLAASPALAQGDLEAFRVHAMRFLAGNPIAVNVTLVDGSGMQVLNTSRPPGSSPVKAQPELAALLRGGDFGLTNLMQGPVLGEPLVALGVPARVDGVTRYVVGAALRPSVFEPLLKAPGIHAEWTASVLDRNGRIVARVPRRDEFIGQPATPELAEAVRGGSTGTLHAFTKEGTPVLAAFAGAPQSGFAVAVGVPERSLLADLRLVTAFATIVILFVLLVSLLAARRLARRITHSIQALATAARRLRQGHVAGAPRLGFREAEQVRLGLNISAAQLQQTSAELEDLRGRLNLQHAALSLAVMEAATQPMLLIDDHERIVGANAAARALFGGARMAGIELGDIFVPDDGLVQGDAQPGALRLPGGERRRVMLHESTAAAGDAALTALGIVLQEPGATILPG